MTELKSIIHDIPQQQLYLYYGLIVITYVVFFRRTKYDKLTMILLLSFNMALVTFVDVTDILGKLLVGAAVAWSLIHARMTSFRRIDLIVSMSFVAYSVTFFYSYSRNDLPLVHALLQYYKYLIPCMLFLSLRYSMRFKDGSRYYMSLFISLIMLQVVFSIYKLIIMGFRENIVGSIANAGGDAAVLVTVIGSMAYWVSKDCELKGSDYLFPILTLIIAAASDKRAIWMLFPMILVMFNWDKVKKVKIKNIGIILIMIPLTVYVGFRLNPTLNPDRKLWGSFDLDYGLNYSLDYSGFSEDKLSQQRGEGRWGASLVIIQHYIGNVRNQDTLFGIGRDRNGRVIWGNVDVDEIGLKRDGTMISFIGRSLLIDGLLGTVFYLVCYISMISTISNRRIRRVFMTVVVWDALLYSGIFQMGVLSVWAICLFSNYTIMNSLSIKRSNVSGSYDNNMLIPLRSNV